MLWLFLVSKKTRDTRPIFVCWMCLLCREYPICWSYRIAAQHSWRTLTVMSKFDQKFQHFTFQANSNWFSARGAHPSCASKQGHCLKSDSSPLQRWSSQVYWGDPDTGDSVQLLHESFKTWWKWSSGLWSFYRVWAHGLIGSSSLAESVRVKFSFLRQLDE